MDRGEIIIYQTADGETRLDVRMENDSVWLTQAQIAHLFGVDRTVIVRHVNNIYKSSELERDVTCAKIAHVQHEGQRQVRRMIPFYNLDMILSVGYRVNSKNATQFRIWANKVLKEYLIKGYAVNSQAKAEQLEELKQTVHLLSNVLSAKDVTHEKDESFKSTMGAIYQTFGGRDLYPSVEEKAANLLYLTVKNHSFSDGNKRIAAFLFLWFLENNRILYRADGSRLLDNNTLVALTLMIAESRTEEKDVMTKVVVNLINKNN